MTTNKAADMCCHSATSHICLKTGKDIKASFAARILDEAVEL